MSEHSTEHDSSSSLTKAELAEELADRIGLSTNVCQRLVVSFFNKIKDSLIEGEEVKLPHFATFGLRDKVARPGRNPRTGEPVEVSARRVVTFRPSRSLRRAITEQHATSTDETSP